MWDDENILSGIVPLTTAGCLLLLLLLLLNSHSTPPPRAPTHGRSYGGSHRRESYEGLPHRLLGTGAMAPRKTTMQGPDRAPLWEMAWNTREITGG